MVKRNGFLLPGAPEFSRFLCDKLGSGLRLGKRVPYAGQEFDAASREIANTKPPSKDKREFAMAVHYKNGIVGVHRFHHLIKDKDPYTLLETQLAVLESLQLSIVTLNSLRLAEFRKSIPSAAVSSIVPPFNVKLKLLLVLSLRKIPSPSPSVIGNAAASLTWADV